MPLFGKRKMDSFCVHGKKNMWAEISADIPIRDFIFCSLMVAAGVWLCVIRTVKLIVLKLGLDEMNEKWRMRELIYVKKIQR